MQEEPDVNLLLNDLLLRKKAQLFPMEITERYKILKLVGKGAYGEVWKAYDKKNQSYVAIKKISGLFIDSIDTKRNLRELFILRKLNHPNIVKILDLFYQQSQNYIEPPQFLNSDYGMEDFDTIYIIMEFIDCDLRKFINEGYSQLNEDQFIVTNENIRKIMKQILETLQYLEKRGIVHRDIKPNNILIDRKTFEVKLCDFGLARSILNDKFRPHQDKYYQNKFDSTLAQKEKQFNVHHAQNSENNKENIPILEVPEFSLQTPNISQNNREFPISNLKPIDPANNDGFSKINDIFKSINQKKFLIDLQDFEENTHKRESQISSQENQSLQSFPMKDISNNSKKVLKKMQTPFQTSQNLPKDSSSQLFQSQDSNEQFILSQQFQNSISISDKENFSFNKKTPQQSQFVSKLSKKRSTNYLNSQNIDDNNNKNNNNNHFNSGLSKYLTPKFQTNQKILEKDNDNSQEMIINEEINNQSQKENQNIVKKTEIVNKVLENQEKQLLNLQKIEERLILKQIQAFGFTQENTDDELTFHIGSRWYRPPEIILLNSKYDYKIDIWSLGCVFVELLTLLSKDAKKGPIFPGKSCYPMSPIKRPIPKSNGDFEPSYFVHLYEQDDQLNKIIQVLGTYEQMQDLSFIERVSAQQFVQSFPKQRGSQYADILPNIPEQTIDFLNKMLQFNPQKRFSSEQLLEHEYMKHDLKPLEKMENQIREQMVDKFFLFLKQAKDFTHELSPPELSELKLLSSQKLEQETIEFLQKFSEQDQQSQQQQSQSQQQNQNQDEFSKQIQKLEKKINLLRIIDSTQQKMREDFIFLDFDFKIHSDPNKTYFLDCNLLKLFYMRELYRYNKISEHTYKNQVRPRIQCILTFYKDQIRELPATLKHKNELLIQKQQPQNFDEKIKAQQQLQQNESKHKEFLVHEFV